MGNDFATLAVAQNDPTELLQVFDASGNPTGRAKPRAAIHLDGDWHRAFHCWILRRGGREVVLQRRSLIKDTFPGCWDAAAAGHWRFGESPAEAAREITEELGIEVPFGRLEYRGQESSSRSFPNGLTDREWHEVYLLRDDRPLLDYRPDPAEVIGLAAFLVRELVGGGDTFTPVEAVSVSQVGELKPASFVVRRDELVPYSRERLARNLGGLDRVDTI
jgi:isopentenyldiphosphate isomerase